MKKNKGFTLIELIAIVVILAAIFLVAFPVLLGTTKKAQNSKQEVNKDILCDAGKTYIYSKTQEFPQLSNSGEQILIKVSELVEFGIVDLDIDSLQDDSTLIYTVETDGSLTCEYNPDVIIPNITDDDCVPGLVYNGHEQDLLRNKIADVIYTNYLQTNAGTYTITALIDPSSEIEWQDFTTGAKSIVCKIDKIDDNIEVTPTIKIYDNKPLEPIITTDSGLPTDKTFYSDSQCTTVSDARNVGTYYVIATTEGNVNYRPANSGCKIAGTISPAGLTPVAQCQDKTYDGTTDATCTVSVVTVMTGDNITVSSFNCAFENKNAAVGKTVYCTNVVATGTGRSNYEMVRDNTTTTATIRKQDVNPPRNLQISTGGIVTWDPPEVDNTTGYEISIGGGTYYTASSGVDKFTDLTGTTGEKTVYVRSVNSDKVNYNTPSSSISKKVNIYKVTIQPDDATYGQVDISTVNVISGSTYSTNNNKLTISGTNKTYATVTATAKTVAGYKPSFSSWSPSSGTISGDTTIIANFNKNPNTLTIVLNANGAQKNNGTNLTDQVIGSYNYKYDQNFDATYGLWNYNGGSFNLTKEGYGATGYWHLGSGSSSTKVHQDTGLPKVTDVATAFGVLNDLKANDTTITLYAGWTPNTLTVNYYANGAKKNSSGQNVSELLGTDTLYYDGTVTTSWPTDYADPYGYKLVPNQGYSKEGYYHVGSGTSSTKVTQDLGETTVNGAASRLGVLNNLKAGNTTVNIYAGWKANTYTIHYNANGGSGAPADQPYDYDPTATISLSNTEPTFNGYAFGGWSEDSNASTATYRAGASFPRSKIPSSGTVINLYAVWTQAPEMTCSVTGTIKPGTGTRSYGLNGYLVTDAKVVCRCDAKGAIPDSITIGGTAITSLTHEEGNVYKAESRVTEPAMNVNINATCDVGSVHAPASTGNNNYYRPYGLTYYRNGADKINNSTDNATYSSMQYLAANRTNASGSNADVGEKINLPTVYRSAETNTARCGISCAALGWNLTSAHTAAYAASGAKVNMCTTGKDDCTGSSSSMIALGETSTRRELYAISYGTLKLPILRSHNGVYSGRAAFVEKTDSHYTGLGFVNGDDIEINHDGTSYDPQYAESHQVSATLWNTANTVYTKIGPMCSGITGGTSADQSSRGIGSTGLRYTMYDSNGNATQDIIIKENAVNTFGDPVTTIAFPLNKYEDIGWWCDTSGIVPPANDSWNERGGLGWNLTINPNGGTYNGTTGTTTLKMQWGSRQFNKITPPTRTGYKFIGIYNTSSDTGGTAIYTVAGKAAVTSNSPYWTSTIEWPYTLWSGTYNKQTESAITGWARWEIKSTTISFVSQGTTVSSRKYTFEDEIVAPSATTRTGYSFSQWCSGTNCYGPTTQYGGSVMKPARIDSYLLDSSSWTFTATWTANKYTISFDARTDQSHATAPNPDPVNVYYDSSVTANLPNDSKFAGWYTKSTEGNIKVFNADGSPVRGSTYNGTTYFNSSGKWNCTRNVTLYARYN